MICWHFHLKLPIFLKYETDVMALLNVFFENLLSLVLIEIAYFSETCIFTSTECYGEIRRSFPEYDAQFRLDKEYFLLGLLIRPYFKL